MIALKHKIRLFVMVKAYLQLMQEKKFEFQCLILDNFDERVQKNKKSKWVKNDLRQFLKLGTDTRC